MKACGWLLVGLGLRAALGPAHAALFTTSFPITGTAVSSTNVIGAGSGTATSFDKTNGTPIILGGVPTGTIDAGLYSDRITMYLDNSGNLRLIVNATGLGAGSFSFGSDTFGVSGTVAVGGDLYCVVAGTNSGVRALRLADGAQFSLGTVTNYDFTDVTGLDVFLRPGGTSLNDLAVALVREGPALISISAET